MRKDHRISARRVAVMLCFACMALCATVGLCSCLDKGDAGAAEESVSVTAGAEGITNSSALSPESAVNVYMANKPVWNAMYEYEPKFGYWHGFLDLDFDGVLEMVRGETTGSGRFSYNKYYRISEDGRTVEEIPQSAEMSMGDFDILYAGADNTRLMKSKTDGAMFYYCLDYIFVGIEEHSELYGTLRLGESGLYPEYLFEEYVYCRDSGKPTEYRLCDDDIGTYLSKDEYDRKVAEFFEENEDLNLSWSIVSGSEFDESDENRQRQLLIDAYRSYSYDGFSFE